MIRLIFILFIIFNLGTLNAQKQYCVSEFTAEQKLWLSNFQAGLPNGNLVLTKKVVKKYIPLKIHIVGTSEGTGYYKLEHLLEQICKINEDFSPIGFHFYLKGDIDYINDNLLYTGNSDEIWARAGTSKDNSAVNVFFHGSSETWCGVYFGGVDVVFVVNRCATPASSTLSHELGHLFSLPHTFSGWENGSTPSPNYQERVDGLNCRNAGDGFCDTGPDYVANRWGCNYYTQLTDPIGVKFKPDSSLFMNYASDACQNRFSNEQFLAMDANLQNRQISKSTGAPVPISGPVLLYPDVNDTNLNPDKITLSWNSVKDAKAYYVQVARFAYWEVLNFEKITLDTFVDIKLFGSWPFSWHVKSLSEGNTCSDFSNATTFTTKEIASYISELELGNSIKLYPNPVFVGNKISVKSELDGELIISDLFGRIISKHKQNSGISSEIYFEKSGLYFIEFSVEGISVKQKISVL